MNGQGALRSLWLAAHTYALHTHTQARTYTRTQMHVHTHTHVSTHVCAHTDARTHAHAHTHTPHHRPTTTPPHPPPPPPPAQASTGSSLDAHNEALTTLQAHIAALERDLAEAPAAVEGVRAEVRKVAGELEQAMRSVSGG